MRLNMISVKAKDVPNDVFIYLPDEKLFFFVDDKEVFDNHTTFYHEIDITEDGLKEIDHTVDNDEMISVVYEYVVNPDIFWE